MKTMTIRPSWVMRSLAAAAFLILPARVALTSGATFVGNIGTATQTKFANSSISITVGASGVAAGDHVIVGFDSGTFAGAVGCSDSKGNTYSVDADRNNGGAGRVSICSAHIVTPLVNGDTITATYPAFSGYTAATANEFSGLRAVGALDKTSTATGNSASPSSGATAMTTQADELLYGAIFFSGTNFATFSPGAGYTRTNPDLSGRPLASEYRIVSATGTYQADGALSKGNQWAAAIATYKAAPAVPVGACAPSSSLSVLVTGTKVTSYVPRGGWSIGSPNVSVVNVEGVTLGVPTMISTPDVINSCASNSTTGQTICTANNNHVYAISGTSLVPPTLLSGASGLIGFSGGSCTNCGVAMGTTNAVIGLSFSPGAGGYQFLDLSPPAFPLPAFASQAPLGPFANISENILLDPIRNLMLSPNENGNFEIVNVATPATPLFFENAVSGAPFFDSAGEDCSTGLALAPAEFTDSSQVYITDLTQATFTPGVPAGTWSAPSALQTLTESSLSEGASGIAVAQGTHTGVVTGEFGGNTITAIALPATSGSGTPSIIDWVTCSIPNIPPGVAPFETGLDPHTVTAYQGLVGGPYAGDAIALIANFDGAPNQPTFLAVVDLTKMLNPLIVPRTVGPGLGHACLTGPLPATVVSFIPVP